VLSPLAGFEPPEGCDAFALAQAIEDAAGDVEDLPAKFFIAVDGGDAMPLDAIGADLHLVATGSDAIAFGTSSRDGLHWIGTSSLSHTPAAVHVILSGFANLRREGRTEARRLRDLESDFLRKLAACAALGPVVQPPSRPVAPRAGVIPLESKQAVLVALSFGRCNAGQLVQAADWSEHFGSGEIRLSFTRGLLVPTVAAEHVPFLLDAAEGAGFITDAGNPCLSLLACPGRPDCSSALTAAPADALRIAQSCVDLLRQGATLHVSGCSKGCAHPGSAELTLVGRADGRYDVVPAGSARDAPSIHLSIDEIMSRLSPLYIADDLRRAFQEAMR
jgi:precorrin-3B synthase